MRHAPKSDLQVCTKVQKCLKMPAPPLTNRVQEQADDLMFGLCNEPNERITMVDRMEATPVNENQPKSAPDELGKLINTQMALMKAMQPPYKRKPGRERE